MYIVMPKMFMFIVDYDYKLKSILHHDTGSLLLKESSQ